MYEYFVYIMTSRSGVLYTGVTNDVIRRVQEHKTKKTGGFTAKYNIDRLVYCESTDSIESAIIWEKKIIAITLDGKLRNKLNPDFI